MLDRDRRRGGKGKGGEGEKGGRKGRGERREHEKERKFLLQERGGYIINAGKRYKGRPIWTAASKGGPVSKGVPGAERTERTQGQ